MVADEDIIKAIDEYGDMLLRIACQNLGRREDAEDVVQEALLRLLRQPFDGPDHNLRAWLIRVTINLCRDHRRTAWVRRVGPLTEELAGFDEEEQGLLDELARLPVHYRNTLYLHYYEGYTIAEIAGILGKNPKTVGTWLVRGRSRLKSILIEGGVICE